jgi:hypothetical protein
MGRGIAQVFATGEDIDKATGYGFDFRIERRALFAANRPRAAQS